MANIKWSAFPSTSVPTAGDVLVGLHSGANYRFTGVTVPFSPAVGGTGINNGSSTLTLAGSLATVGAFASTFTMTNTTSVTFPTSGTLATTSQIPTGAALTRTNDTNVTLTLGGSPATSLVNAASITAGWTGTLSGARGGTGIANTGLTINLGSATTGFVLTSDSSGNATWQSVISSGAISTINGDSGSVTPTAGVVTINGGSTGLTTSGSGSTLSLTGTLGIGNGGTGVTSVTTVPGTNAWAGWDINQNMSADNFIQGFTTRVTTGGTASINVNSKYVQEFTGTLTELVVLPLTSDLIAGQSYYIINNSSGALNVIASDTSVIQVMAASSSLFLTCLSTSITSSAAWQATYIIDNSGSGTVNNGTQNQLTWYAATGNTVSGLTGANSASLVTNGSGVPSWQTLSAGQILVGTTSGAPAATAISSGTNILVANGSGSISVGITGTIGVTNGGTGIATATAYSLIAAGTTSTGAWQSVGTGTSGQLLQSGGAAALPSWTTATFPTTAGSAGTILRSNGTNWINSTATFADTYGASTLLYSNGVNTVTGLATANSAVLVTNSSGVPSLSSTMTNGQLIIGSTGATPTAATLIPGAGVSITNGAASITIAATGGGIAWTTTAGTTQAIAVNNGYVSSNAAQSTFTLPGTAAVGDVAAVEGLGAGGWILAANTGQTIKIGVTTTSSGGTLTSAAASDNVYVTCIVANTTWRVRSTNSTGLTPA